MLNRIIKCCLGAFLMAGCLALTAQEVSDSGVQAVQEAQESKAPEVPKKTSALALLKQICKQRKWREGWDEDKGRAFIIQPGEFKCKDPAQDEDFFAKREKAAKKAILSAKADFIKMINQDMSAADCLEIPGTDVEKKLHPELVALNDEIASVAKQIAGATKEADAVLYNEALRLAATGAAECLDTILRRLEGDGKMAAGVANVADKLEAAKNKLKTLKQKHAELVAKAEAFKETIVEKQVSTVESMAKMPLCGATVIMQTESWDKTSGLYQVAILLCWSKELERSARAVLTGEDLRVKPSAKSMDIHDWLDTQDLATIMGQRQYVDNKGNRWYIGISARPYSDDMGATQRRKNKTKAEASAEQMAVFSLFADVESYKMAQTAVETREIDGIEEQKAAETSAEKLSQAFNNRKVRGLGPIVREEGITHPITGKQMFVAIYGINSSKAKAALEVEMVNVATAIQANRYQTVERGRDAANAAAIEASKNRKEDFDKGYNEQTEKTNQELNKREGQQKAFRQMQGNTPDATKGPAQSKGGVFGGDVDVEDNF